MPRKVPGHSPKNGRRFGKGDKILDCRFWICDCPIPNPGPGFNSVPRFSPAIENPKSKMENRVAEEKVLYEVRNQTAWITLNRPESLNAVNREMVRSIVDYCRAAEEDPNVQVVIFK